MKNTRNQYKELNGRKNVTGFNINYYRTKKNLSAQQLSDRLIMRGLDLHRQSIFSIESGKRTVTDFELALIAEELEVSTDLLLEKFIKFVRNENN